VSVPAGDRATPARPATPRRTDQPTTPPRRSRMNWRGFWRRALFYSIVGVGGFGIGYLLVAFLVFPPQLVPDDAKVPSVVGLMYDDAARRLTAAGFTAAQGEQRFNELAPKGTVLAQTPPFGSREARGATVTLDVSAGERRTQVPPVVGQTQQLAQTALESAGLEVGTITERESDSPRGAVLESMPASGQLVPPNTPIALVVSSGPALVRVPDVVGQDMAQARMMLEQLGLVVGTMAVDTTATGQPPNVVLGQTPAAGSSTRAGTVVALRVSGSVR